MGNLATQETTTTFRTDNHRAARTRRGRVQVCKVSPAKRQPHGARFRALVQGPGTPRGHSFCPRRPFARIERSRASTSAKSCGGAEIAVGRNGGAGGMSNARERCALSCAQMTIEHWLTK
jgi:hypothetical protein